jgi:hypothetical protein
VVAGEKLKTPLSSVPYQEVGGMTVETSKATVQSRKETSFLQVVHAIGQYAGGDDDQEDASPSEEAGQVDLHHSAVDQVAEQNRDRQTERRTDQRDGDGSGVSRRSLGGGSQEQRGLQTLAATASMATTTSDQGLASAALSICVRRPPEMVRAALTIQKIIQVTKPTAMIDNNPPISSCASKLRPFGPKVSAAPRAKDAAVAIPTPCQIRGNSMRRSDLIRYAIRMLRPLAPHGARSGSWRTSDPRSLDVRALQAPIR